MKKITIYTDGACSKNPGPGGWGALLMYNNNTEEISGCKADTTNNIMELTAVIEALKTLNEPYDVELYSDSAYIVNAFLENWLDNWIDNGWKTYRKKPVKNKDLWQELYNLTKMHKVTFIKVDGHSYDKFNNRCDKLAKQAIKNL